MIQHGAQEKYVANMRNNEKDKPIVSAVAKMCEAALAACTPKGWEIIQGLDQLKMFYSESGLKIKNTWDNANVKSLNNNNERPPSVQEARKKYQEDPQYREAVKNAKKKNDDYLNQINDETFSKQLRRIHSHKREVKN